MDSEVKVKVDEYERWCLKRLDLEELADRDEEGRRLAGEVLMGREHLPQFNRVFHNCPPAHSRYDLEALKFDFTLIVPTHLKQRNTERPNFPICGGKYGDWDTGQDLPFPPALVEGITSRDLVFLKKTFELSGADRYTRWSGVYQDINRFFEEQQEDVYADDIMEWLKKKLPQGVPIAPVFLISAQVFMIDKDTPQAIRRIRLQQDHLRKKDAEAEKLLNALSVFEDAVGVARKKKWPGYPDTLAEHIGYWLDKFQLDIQWDELLKLPDTWSGFDRDFKGRIQDAMEGGELQVDRGAKLRLSDMLTLLKYRIEHDLGGIKAVPELWRDKIYAPNVPENLQPGNSVIYPLLDAVSQFIKDRGGLKRGFIEKSLRLFQEWDIIISEPAFRMWKSRL